MAVLLVCSFYPGQLGQLRTCVNQFTGPALWTHGMRQCQGAWPVQRVQQKANPRTPAVPVAYEKSSLANWPYVRYFTPTFAD